MRDAMLEGRADRVSMNNCIIREKRRSTPEPEWRRRLKSRVLQIKVCAFN
ncbi:hypothetical protein Hanom_Chr04g00320471 [Helianthus anomalus]